MIRVRSWSHFGVPSRIVRVRGQVMTIGEVLSFGSKRERRAQKGPGREGLYRVSLESIRYTTDTHTRTDKTTKKKEEKNLEAEPLNKAQAPRNK